MKLLNHASSFIMALLFLKEYNVSEEEKEFKHGRAIMLVAVWGLYLLGLQFNVYEYLGTIHPLIPSLCLISFILWYISTLVYISSFAQRDIHYVVMLMPMTLVLMYVIISWNSHTSYGALGGIADAITMIVQASTIVVFPTFMFALRMVKIENYIKGIFLFVVTTVSSILGIAWNIGTYNREGYLSDTTGYFFVAFVLLLLYVSAYFCFDKAVYLGKKFISLYGNALKR